MSEFFRSKVAMFLAGAYLALVLVCVGYLALIDSSNVVVHLGLMIWTFPWSLLFPLILVKLAMIADVHGRNAYITLHSALEQGLVTLRIY